MSYKAVFVGGAFDMIKRVLSKDLEYVSFYEPEDRVAEFYSLPVTSIPYREVKYRLAACISDGTLIYEYRPEMS